MEKDSVEDLIKTTLGEIEKVLGSHTAVGEPIKVGDTTIVPLISAGFGFGGGGGTGKGDTKQKHEGHGEGIAGGGGAGGGIKPIAVIIVDKNGARIEPIKSGMASAIEKISKTIPEKITKFTEKQDDTQKR
jgi:uncharacterized spore protein YtfJ